MSKIYIEVPKNHKHGDNKYPLRKGGRILMAVYRNV